MTDAHDEKLDQLWLITKALYRASLAGFLLLLVWTPFTLILDQLYALHNAIIPLQRTTYNAMMFGFLALFKTLVIVFLFLPAVGLHRTIIKQRKRKQAD
ncbi:MAG: hypothetical protein CMJ76_15130 [Planctomycetaceae bacterium]|nr:hypothetical protein [Planctomycetaceae bacterium]|tara:strand:- start:772 stop:1068 length:297 start_codon:yes stop_codon:yes gene_type:complete